MKRTLLTLLSALLLSLSLTAQGQQGTFNTSPPNTGNSHNTVEVKPPSSATAGTTIEVTKVEQQVVGGGWADVTSAVTICDNKSASPDLRFGENVNGMTFRISYKMSTSPPNGDPPTGDWSQQGTAACPIVKVGRGSGA